MTWTIRKKASKLLTSWKSFRFCQLENCARKLLNVVCSPLFIINLLSVCLALTQQWNRKSIYVTDKRKCETISFNVKFLKNTMPSSWTEWMSALNVSNWITYFYTISTHSKIKLTQVWSPFFALSKRTPSYDLNFCHPYQWKWKMALITQRRHFNLFSLNGADCRCWASV